MNQCVGDTVAVRLTSRWPTESHPVSSISPVALVLVVLGGALALPYAMVVVLGGGAVRSIFPAYTLAFGLLALSWQRPLYPAFIIAVFAFSPFIRRFAEYSGGFTPFNPILLGPYTALLPSIPALLRRMLGPRRSLSWQFSAIVACALYGCFIALLKMRFVPALYEPMRWVLPVSLCAFIMDDRRELPAIKRAVFGALLIVVPLLSAYGVLQYLSPPPWDAFWLHNIKNPTFGRPLPFQIRVFSMMNSPLSVSVFVASGMILLAGEGPMSLAVAATGLPLLALALIRTAWFGFSVGLLVLFLQSPLPRKLTLLAATCVVAIVAAAVVAGPNITPDVRNALTDRLNTLGDLRTDSSANDRMQTYSAFFSGLADQPFGGGFGMGESVATSGEKRDVPSLDSGFLETFLIFGVAMGTVYVSALATLVAAAFRATHVTRGRLSAGFAVMCSLIAILPFSNFTGEGGVLGWTGIGLLLGTAELLQPLQGARRPDRRLGGVRTDASGV